MFNIFKTSKSVNLSIEEFLDKIEYGNLNFKKGFFSDPFKNLIDGMLSYDPAKRFSISKIKEHPWYKGDISDINDLKQEFVKKRENVEIALEEERKNNEIIKMKKKKKLEEKDKLIQNGPKPFLRGSSEKVIKFS